jgi:methionyl aminopeptidase
MKFLKNNMTNTPEEIIKIRAAASLVKEIHDYIKPYIKPGITTKELDKLVYDYTIEHNATPAFLGYGGFPATINASVDNVLVHGIPNDTPLKELLGITVISTDFKIMGKTTAEMILKNVKEKRKNVFKFIDRNSM